MQLGELDEAHRELQIVLQGAPQILAAIRAVAEIHHKRGNLPDAISQYRIALKLAPNDPELEWTVSELTQTLAQTVNTPERHRALAVVATLERWLVALHVTRAQRSA
jgi:tetratricopeptide (TPR) repeat protein